MFVKPKKIYIEIRSMATTAILPSSASNYSSINYCTRFFKHRLRLRSSNFQPSCSLNRPNKVVGEKDTKREYSPGVIDAVFLRVFRQKMVQEVGWDSEKAGYDGLIDVATHLMKARSNSATREAAVRILRSLFPPLLLELYRILIAPIGGGKIAAVMVARVTALSCQWLMGSCAVNSVDFEDGTLWNSGVYVEKCKYLEESKCVGICLNTCKFPTQFKFGVVAPQPEDDVIFKEPCLEICPNVNLRKKIIGRDTIAGKCSKA
ncbi:beta-carotene isomerase D27, chloroplastic isoform X2 [Impatiens glandulifera]|uniref:beta-carotene isomerase D27, chloroplastic isoform X2 n=1 Tax=Impatiens glandulifera TaxID=253017 RepID=UPI001FB104D1|nr:beta-carotene isomerase D27, chloroplastic isoform X2 [Impatiens glandulifera]